MTRFYRDGSELGISSIGIPRRVSGRIALPVGWRTKVRHPDSGAESRRSNGRELVESDQEVMTDLVLSRDPQAASAGEVSTVFRISRK